MGAMYPQNEHTKNNDNFVYQKEVNDNLMIKVTNLL